MIVFLVSVESQLGSGGKVVLRIRERNALERFSQPTGLWEAHHFCILWAHPGRVIDCVAVVHSVWNVPAKDTDSATVKSTRKACALTCTRAQQLFDRGHALDKK